MTAKDIQEFQVYLDNCTDQQVEGVLEKEMEAANDQDDSERAVYAELARTELRKRRNYDYNHKHKN